MIHIDIVCVGKLKETYLKDAIWEYSKRLSKYCQLQIIELPDEKVPTTLNASIIKDIKQKESTQILEHIKKDSYIIALDLKGKSYTSEQFSEKLTFIPLTHSRITFIIGGTLGMTEDLLSVCNESICFSKMTFPHQLIRIFLLEQLFRGFKIANHETYHH